MSGVVATCQLCQGHYLLEQFRVLPLVGYMDDPPLRLELRNCCGSTMAILVDHGGEWVKTHPREVNDAVQGS